MTVLAKTALQEAMKAKEDPLVVTPLLDPNQIREASVDVRLGHEFIVWRRSTLKSIDRSAPESEWAELLHRSQERVRVAFREEFVLHPGELVLGSTLEYLSIPGALSATVEGRSSWGRLGIIVATATAIAPGFKGCLTLEIINGGEVPAVVYPGILIAQLIVQRAIGDGSYDGRYRCPTGPEYTKPDTTWEARFWGRQR